MDLPLEASTPATARRPPPAPAGAVRRARHRRPTGAPPPLPHHLQDQLGGFTYIIWQRNKTWRKPAHPDTTATVPVSPN